MLLPCLPHYAPPRRIAPLPAAGLLAAAASFLLLCAVLSVELQSSLVLSRRWLLRLPLVLVASSELVKLRFVVQQQLTLEVPWGCSFWLYCCYVAVQVGVVYMCAGKPYAAGKASDRDISIVAQWNRRTGATSLVRELDIVASTLRDSAVVADVTHLQFWWLSFPGVAASRPAFATLRTSWCLTCFACLCCFCCCPVGAVPAGVPCCCNAGVSQGQQGARAAAGAGRAAAVLGGCQDVAPVVFIAT